MTLTQRITWAIVELQTVKNPDLSEIILTLELALAEAIKQDWDQRAKTEALLRTAKVMGE